MNTTTEAALNQAEDARPRAGVAPQRADEVPPQRDFAATAIAKQASGATQASARNLVESAVPRSNPRTSRYAPSPVRRKRTSARSAAKILATSQFSLNRDPVTS